MSRVTQDNNPSQGVVYDWAASMQDQCGTQVQVAPEHDVNVCGGQTVESVNDAGNATVLAMYPRQPFNYAGRTGTIEFNVSDNTQGGHGAWPVLAITDQPIPAPFSELPGIEDNARNSVVVQFDVLPNNGTCVSAEIDATVNYNYVSEPTNYDGCVTISPGPGVDNHVEVQINSGGVKVYMSQPGKPTSTQLVADSQFSVPLSQGLVWLEDAHYNGDKFGTQGTNTFTWSDLAFDGPVEPRDLAFDVLDNTDPGGSGNGQPMTNLGYDIPPGGGSLTLKINGVTSSDISNATGALLTMNYFPLSAQNLTYSVNGHAPLTFNWPYANDNAAPVGPTNVSQSVALPVPLSDIVAGTNTVTFSTSDTANGVATANFDLILQGAAGVVPPQ